MKPCKTLLAPWLHKENLQHPLKGPFSIPVDKASNQSHIKNPLRKLYATLISISKPYTAPPEKLYATPISRDTKCPGAG